MDAMNRELLLQELLQDLYNAGELSLYDHIAAKWPGDPETFSSSKSLGDQLVTEKLAHYTDEQHTLLSISHHGRFWILQGGYPVFLRDSEHKHKEHHHEENSHQSWDHDLKEDLRVARLRFTKYRILTYWWSFAFSIIGFLLSLLSIYLVLSGRK